MELVAPSWVAHNDLYKNGPPMGKAVNSVVPEVSASTTSSEPAGTLPRAAIALTAGVALRRRPFTEERRKMKEASVALRAELGDESELDVERVKAAAAEEFAPIKSFQRTKEDWVLGWGLLDDQSFALRLAVIFALGFVPGIAFGSAVFPMEDVRNTAAASLLGAGVALIFVIVFVLRLASMWDSVNKSLLKTTFTVEYDPTKKVGFSSGAGGAYIFKAIKSDEDAKRDKLLSQYETEPAVGRLRAYLLGCFVTSAASFTASWAVEGEMLMAEEEEEEEEVVNDTGFYMPAKQTKKKCGAGCMPGMEAEARPSGPTALYLP